MNSPQGIRFTCIYVPSILPLTPPFSTGSQCSPQCDKANPAPGFGPGPFKANIHLGHALSMKAIHGGKAKNDKIDSRKIAILLRGGMLPQAYVYPAKMRAARDLLRRRDHFMRKRAELFAHIQNTRNHYNLPDPLGCLAKPQNREGIIQRFEDPSIQQSIAANLLMIEAYDRLLTQLEHDIIASAK
jgi:hypothetical protein